MDGTFSPHVHDNSSDADRDRRGEVFSNNNNSNSAAPTANNTAIDMTTKKTDKDKHCISSSLAKEINAGDDVTEEQKSRDKEDEENSSGTLECPVCLQTCIYPVQLPCEHIFCFLCVKGVANRSKRCALCRQQIPADFFCQPNLVEWEGLENPMTFDNGYGWFYGGVNGGWWQYDDRTSQELEIHHKAGHASCELLIAGYVYIIDLTNMVQMRRNDRTKKRRIKRDLVSLPGCKGIAGLKISCEDTAADSDRPGADGHESGLGRQAIPIQRTLMPNDNQSRSPPTPYNTPQTPQTPSESPPMSAEPDLSVQLERLRLENVPMSSIVHGGSSGSSHGYNTPELQSSTLDDTARLYNVSASLEQYQADATREENMSSVTDEEDLNGHAKFV